MLLLSLLSPCRAISKSWEYVVVPRPQGLHIKASLRAWQFHVLSCPPINPMSQVLFWDLIWQKKETETHQGQITYGHMAINRRPEFKLRYDDLNWVLPDHIWIRTWKSQPLVPWSWAGFGGMVFSKEATKVSEVISMDPEPITGVLTRSGHQDTDTHRGRPRELSYVIRSWVI